jgi:outer membrane PBP1 activator LpoA protein
MLRLIPSNQSSWKGIWMAVVIMSILAGCSTSATHHSVYFSGTIEAEQDQFLMDGNV